jgi:hypothetical protein
MPSKGSSALGPSDGFQIGNYFFGCQGSERHRGSSSHECLFASGGRNAEHGMIALRVRDPAARHEEAASAPFRSADLCAGRAYLLWLTFQS